jgi:hypothetical protein
MHDFDPPQETTCMCSTVVCGFIMCTDDIHWVWQTFQGHPCILCVHVSILVCNVCMHKQQCLYSISAKQASQE